MELDNLDILKNIKRIEVSDSLYHTIESRFEKNRENNRICIIFWDWNEYYIIFNELYKFKFYIPINN